MIQLRSTDLCTSLRVTREYCGAQNGFFSVPPARLCRMKLAVCMQSILRKECGHHFSAILSHCCWLLKPQSMLVAGRTVHVLPALGAVMAVPQAEHHPGVAGLRGRHPLPPGEVPTGHTTHFREILQLNPQLHGHHRHVVTLWGATSSFLL